MALFLLLEVINQGYFVACLELQLNISKIVSLYSYTVKEKLQVDEAVHCNTYAIFSSNSDPFSLY